MRLEANTELDALRFEHKRRQLAVLAGVLIAPTLVFVGIDLILLGRNDPRFFALVLIRVFAIGVAAFAAFRMTRITDEARFDRAVIAVSYLIVALVLAVHLLRPPTMLSPYFFEVVLIIALYALLPSRWRDQVLPASLLTGAGVLLLFQWHVELTLVERVSIGTALMIANGVGIAVAWHWRWFEEREHSLRRREQESLLALASTTAELRILQKILPICSHCRHVRDEAGAWAQLEAYVHEHSDTRFSHGICPDCLVKHYPDLQEPVARP